MAEAPEKPGHPYEVAFLLGAILVGLFVLWWARGGPQHSSFQSMFLSAPPALQTPAQ